MIGAGGVSPDPNPAATAQRLTERRFEQRLAMTPNEAVAEVKRWRSIAEQQLGTIDQDEVEQYLALSGLSIQLGEYGEWGRDTLECLFAELGIQPGDDFQTAVEHASAVSGDKK